MIGFTTSAQRRSVRAVVTPVRPSGTARTTTASMMTTEVPAASEAMLMRSPLGTSRNLVQF